MKKLLYLALLLAIPRIAFAGQSIAGNIIEKTCQPIDLQEAYDVKGINRFSLQAIYTNGTPSGHNVTDGVKSSNQLTVTTGFGNSLAGHTISINGTTFTFGAVQSGVTIATQATANLQAQFISSAIVNSGQISVITSTHVAAVVYATATAVGLGNYAVTSSTTGLQWSQLFFQNGVASMIDLSANSITKASHGFTTGLRVLYASSTVTTGIGGLNGGTTYYAIRIDDSSYKLATSSTLAVAGTAVDITSQPGSQTFTVTPPTLLAGSGASFKWQASNDNSNWTDVPSISSVTYTAAGNSIWNFGEFNYRYIRMNFVQPTNGCLGLTVPLFGWKD